MTSYVIGYVELRETAWREAYEGEGLSADARREGINRSGIRDGDLGR
jgi:hypothetical protein